MRRAPVHEQYNCTGASMSWLCCLLYLLLIY